MVSKRLSREFSVSSFPVAELKIAPHEEEWMKAGTQFEYNMKDGHGLLLQAIALGTESH